MPAQVRAMQSQIPAEIARRLASHGFPRLMNQIQSCCLHEEIPGLLNQLSDWDLVVINADLMDNIPEYLGPAGKIRSSNPNTILLAYISGQDIYKGWTQPLLTRLKNGLDPKWYLRDTEGNPIPLFHVKGADWTLTLNVTTAINQYLPEFISQNVLNTNAVDGIFYDWASTSISGLNHRKLSGIGKIDIDGDGKGESDKDLDKMWIQGWLTMLKNSRAFFPAGTIIIGNGGWNDGNEYASELNGLMIEQFLKAARFIPDKYGWGAQMCIYAFYQNHAVAPRMSIIMANDNQRNFQKLRFSLASTLLFNGYFCFTSDNGPNRSCRWYDEYSVDLKTGLAKRNLQAKFYLGNPLTDAFNAEKSSEKLEPLLYSNPRKAEKIVWRRDFENGIVLANPDQDLRSVSLGGSFRKIRGRIDPVFNDGAIVERIALEPGDGAILLRIQNNHRR